LVSQVHEHNPDATEIDSPFAYTRLHLSMNVEHLKDSLEDFGVSLEMAMLKHGKKKTIKPVIEEFAKILKENFVEVNQSFVKASEDTEMAILTDIAVNFKKISEKLGPKQKDIKAAGISDDFNKIGEQLIEFVSEHKDHLAFYTALRALFQSLSDSFSKIGKSL